MSTHAATLAAALRDCAYSRLDPPPCRSSLVPGATAAWDDCCHEGTCDGQLWVSVQRIYPSDSFPVQKSGRFRCGASFLVVELQVGIIRCSQALTREGQAPSAARLNSEAEQVLADQDAVLAAVVCCFVPDHIGDSPYSLGAWTPVGPGGGCVGGTTTVQVTVSGCPEGGCE